MYSAALGQRDLDQPVTIASIQSIYKRAAELGRIDVCIVDEAHLIPEDDDGMYRRFLADAKLVNPKLRVFGLTATPYRLKSGMICSPEGVLNEICYEARIPELIRDGYLCPLRSKAGRQKVDTSKVSIRGGEFVPGELEDLVNQDATVNLAVDEIIAETQDRNSVLIFCAGVKHMEHVAAVFRSHGIEVGTVTGETSLFERDLTVERFKAGAIKYLLNVNVLTTGFNAKRVDCVVMLRPTMSPGLYYQMVGRGSGCSPVRRTCLILDFAGNVMRHGPVDAIRMPTRSRPGSGRQTAHRASARSAGHWCMRATRIAPSAARSSRTRGERASSRRDREHRRRAVTGRTGTGASGVRGVLAVHRKRNADPGDPRTMRVDYQVQRGGHGDRQRVGVCGAYRLRRQQSRQVVGGSVEAPLPDTVEMAVLIATNGLLATAKKITVRKEPGSRFERVVNAELGEIPHVGEDFIESVEKELTRRPITRDRCPKCQCNAMIRVPDLQYNRDAMLCGRCNRWVRWAPEQVQADEPAYVIEEDDIPF